jgi:hypothetical protein
VEHDVSFITIAQFDVNAVGDGWEALVSAGQAIIEAHDRNRWACGDLGLRVQATYGESTLRKYAREINIQSSSTLYNYVQVSRFYDEATRGMFPSLSWSHYRAAMRVKDTTLALTILARAADDDAPVAEVERMVCAAVGQRVPPRLLVNAPVSLRSVGVVYDEYTGDAGLEVVLRMTDVDIDDVMLKMENTGTLAQRQFTFKLYESVAP